MKIAMIAAMSTNRVIGINNDLPWHLPDDMKFFMETTKHHCVIMGRKNYESLPLKFRPLPNRTNIVMTRQVQYEAAGCVVFATLQESLDYAKGQGEDLVFIIGGGQIYELALDIADRIYLTEIDAVIEGGEVFFPKLGPMWSEVARQHHPIDDRHQFSFDFVTFEKGLSS